MRFALTISVDKSKIQSRERRITPFFELQQQLGQIPYDIAYCDNNKNRRKKNKICNRVHLLSETH